MMKDTKTEKDKLHRYLDDLYTRDDASQLLQSIKDSENQDILDELAAVGLGRIREPATW